MSDIPNRRSPVWRTLSTCAARLHAHPARLRTVRVGLLRARPKDGRARPGVSWKPVVGTHKTSTKSGNGAMSSRVTIADKTAAHRPTFPHDTARLPAPPGAEFRPTRPAVLPPGQAVLSTKPKRDGFVC